MEDEIADENSVDFDDETADNGKSAKKFRGPAKTYEHVQKFEKYDLALEYIEKEKCWSISRQRVCERGVVIYYRCNRVKKRGPQCPASIYLLSHANQESISFFVRIANTITRTKQRREESTPKSATKSKIFTKKESRCRERSRTLWKGEDSIRHLPSKFRISCSLINRSNTARRRCRLENFVNGATITQRSQHPSDPTTRSLLLTKLQWLEKGTNERTSRIRVFISTRRLLELAKRTSFVHADATYKCIFEGLPVMAIGTTDRDRHYHPFGLGITSGESADDYAFIFRSVKDALSQIFDFAYQPTVLIADATGAITNGFKEVFGDDFQRVTRWARVIRTIDRKLDKISDKEMRQRIRDDIVEMQLCESQAIFDAVVQLFFDKYRAIRRVNVQVDAFLCYFSSEWIASGHKWFQGYSMTTPVTNQFAYQSRRNSP